MTTRMILMLPLALTACLPGGGVAPPSAQDARHVAEVRYDVTFNEETSALRQIRVAMSFDVTNGDAVSLSLPAWTPGAYNLADHAKNVRGVYADQGGLPIRWDKADHDTWRVYPTGAGRVTIGFAYAANELDTGTSWANPREDFVFFNGTSLFLYPEDHPLDFPSKVVFHTEADWVWVANTSSGSSVARRAG